MATDNQLQQLILLRIGANDNRGPVNDSNIGTIWSMYADKKAVAPRLQYLYTLHEALEIWLGQIATGDYISIFLQYDDFSSRQEQWQKLKENAWLEIQAIEKRAQGNRAPVVGSITANAPVEPGYPDTNTQNKPDANSGVYEGSPYYPNYVRRGII